MERENQCATISEPLSGIFLFTREQKHMLSSDNSPTGKQKSLHSANFSCFRKQKCLHSTGNSPSREQKHPSSTNFFCFHRRKRLHTENNNNLCKHNVLRITTVSNNGMFPTLPTGIDRTPCIFY